MSKPVAPGMRVARHAAMTLRVLLSCITIAFGVVLVACADDDEPPPSSIVLVPQQVGPFVVGFDASASIGGLVIQRCRNACEPSSCEIDEETWSIGRNDGRCLTSPVRFGLPTPGDVATTPRPLIENRSYRLTTFRGCGGASVPHEAKCFGADDIRPK
jgi:hypothetical protein